jgi:phage terminase large subunit-like protein
MSDVLLRAFEQRLKGSLLWEFRDASRWADTQLEFLRSDKVYNFLSGGNGSGKTFLGSHWLATRALGFDPVTGQRWTYNKTPNFYAVGPSWEHVDRVMVPAIKQWIPKKEWERPIGRDRIGELKGGARILMKSSNAGAEQFQGDEVDAAWLDEETKDRPVWDEIQARTFRRGGQIFITMTPWQGTRWMHTLILSDEEVPAKMKLFREMAIDENPYYADKPELLERARNQWKGVVKLIRYYGKLLLLAGNPVFDPSVRDHHTKTYRREPQIGMLKAGTFVPIPENDNDARAWLRVVTPPKHGHRYVVGVDVGGGHPTGDYHAALVVDQDTGEQVALGHTRAVEPRVFGGLVDQLGRWYNEAFLVVEANQHGISVIDRLRDLGYGNQFLRQMRDKVGHTIGNRVGFWTDAKSKPDAVDLMTDLVGQNRVKIRDPQVLLEMFHYYWLRDDRQGQHGVGNENPEGHDDCMSALFLAAVGLRAQGFCVAPEPESEPELRHKTWEEAIFEDIENREMDEEELDAFSSDLDTFDEEKDDWWTF